MLLDILMPKTGGLEVLRQVALRDRKTEVLIMTGIEDEKVANEAVRLGAYNYFIKPGWA